MLNHAFYHLDNHLAQNWLFFQVDLDKTYKKPFEWLKWSIVHFRYSELSIKRISSNNSGNVKIPMNKILSPKFCIKFSSNFLDCFIYMYLLKFKILHLKFTIFTYLFLFLGFIGFFVNLLMLRSRFPIGKSYTSVKKNGYYDLQRHKSAWMLYLVIF